MEREVNNEVEVETPAVKLERRLPHIQPVMKKELPEGLNTCEDALLAAREHAKALWCLETNMGGGTQIYNSHVAGLRRLLTQFPDEARRVGMASCLDGMVSKYKANVRSSWRQFVPSILRHTGLGWKEVRAVLELQDKGSTKIKRAAKMGKKSAPSSAARSAAAAAKEAEVKTESGAPVKTDALAETRSAVVARVKRERPAEQQDVVRRDRPAEQRDVVKRERPAEQQDVVKRERKRPAPCAAPTWPPGSPTGTSSSSTFAPVGGPEPSGIKPDPTLERVPAWMLPQDDESALVEAQVIFLDKVVEGAWTVCYGSLGSGAVGVRNENAPPLDEGGDLTRAATADEFMDGISGVDARGRLPTDATVVLFITAEELRKSRRRRSGDPEELAADRRGCSPDFDLERNTLLWTASGTSRCNNIIRTLDRHTSLGGRLFIGVREGPASWVYNLLGYVTRVASPMDCEFLVQPGEQVLVEQGTKIFHRAISVACLSDSLRAGVGLQAVRYPLSGVHKASPVFCPMCCYLGAGCTLYLDGVQSEGVECLRNVGANELPDESEAATPRKKKKAAVNGRNAQEITMPGEKLERRLHHMQSVIKKERPEMPGEKLERRLPHMQPVMKKELPEEQPVQGD